MSGQMCKCGHTKDFHTSFLKDVPCDFDGKCVAGCKSFVPAAVPTVPRVAESLDDLRVGQVVVAKHRVNQDWDYPFEIDQRLPATAFTPWDAYTVVILDEREPEPVTVSRETFDRLAEAIDDDDGRFLKTYDACRALVDEVRGAENG